MKRNHKQFIHIFSEVQQEKKQQEQRIQFLESSIAQERQKSQQQQAEINDLHQMFATIPEKFKAVNKKYEQLLRNELHSTQQQLDNLKNIITNLVHEQSQHSHDIISESTKLVQESFYKTRYENVMHDGCDVQVKDDNYQGKDSRINNSPEKQSILSTLRNSENLDKLDNGVRERDGRAKQVPRKHTSQ